MIVTIVDGVLGGKVRAHCNDDGNDGGDKVYLNELKLFE